MTNFRGMRPTEGASSRSICARTLPMNAWGWASAQQRSTCSIPAEGSTNMAVSPERKMAISATYSSSDIG